MFQEILFSLPVYSPELQQHEAGICHIYEHETE